MSVKPKERKRIVPTHVPDNEAPRGNIAKAHDERPSVLFNEFMRSLDDPNAEEYFNKRAAELGYGEVKIKKKKGVPAKVASPVAPMASLAPPGAVTMATDMGRLKHHQSANLDAFVLRYAALKKKDRSTLREYLSKQHKGHKYFSEETQRFKAL